VLVIIKFFVDHKFTAIFPGQNILGLPEGYRSIAQPMQLSCAQRKWRASKLEYYDSGNNLAYVFAPPTVQQMDVEPYSPLEVLMNKFCPLNVLGRYEGSNTATYQKGGHEEQKIVFNVEQAGGDVNVAFKTANGGQGKGSGKLVGAEIKSISLQSTAPECSGSYDADLKFAGSSVSWSFKGQDCGGPMEGHGTATKVTSGDVNH
jgi:hypothetical protein